VEGISKYSRLRITAVAAFVAVGLVLMAMSASASANLSVKRISLGIRNSSKATIEVKVCTNQHIDSRYEDGFDFASPCGTIDHIYGIPPGQRAIVPNANPVGVIISNFYGHGPAHDRTVYFLARNRAVDYGRVTYHHLYFLWSAAWGLGIDYVRSPVLQDINGVRVEFRRYYDEDRNGENVHLMRIEIRKWPGIG
jgi:hypothetical protein